MLKTTALAAVLALSAAGAQGAEMKLLIGGSMAAPFKEVGAEFAKRSGNTVDYTFDTTGALLKKLRQGEKADIVMVSEAGMDALERDHLVAPGTRVDLSRALIGVSVKAGTAKPDISTPDALKTALMRARAVAYVDPRAGGTSGVYFAGLLKELGIADAIGRKTEFGTMGSEVADAVASGKAELGITFVSEMLPNPGVTIVGPLPGPLQKPTVYVAAIPVGAPNPDQARALLAEMKSAEGAAAIRKSGLEPIDGVH